MKHLLKNLRCPHPKVGYIDGYNQKTRNQNLKVSSEFQIKNVHVFLVFWGVEYFTFFSFELPPPEYRENRLK